MLLHPGRHSPTRCLGADELHAPLCGLLRRSHSQTVGPRERGSEQLAALERRTYLISTILTYAFGFQLLALFLYMFTADNLHTFFVGAMCAAGTLNVNGYGYPTLLLKIFNFLAAGTWLNSPELRATTVPMIIPDKEKVPVSHHPRAACSR